MTIPAKRSPVVVILLSVVSFGFYWLYWYYAINKELAELAPGKVQVNPGMALLAQFVPIVSFVSWYKTAQRVQTAKLAVGDRKTISAEAALLFGVVLPFGLMTWMLQSGLNEAIDAAAGGSAQTSGVALAL